MTELVLDMVVFFKKIKWWAGIQNILWRIVAKVSGCNPSLAKVSFRID